MLLNFVAALITFGNGKSILAVSKTAMRSASNTINMINNFQAKIVILSRCLYRFLKYQY